MPRTKTFQEEEVLRKAMELFWEKGYHATSVQDLVSHLGVNRASLYNTFGDKQELFDRAFAQYRDMNKRGTLQFLAQYPSVKEGIRALLTKSVSDTLTDPARKGCFVVNITTELVPGDEEMAKLLENNRKEFTELFAEYLQTGVDRGEISPQKNIRGLAATLFTLYNGLNVVAKVNSDRESLLEQIEMFLSLLD